MLVEATSKPAFPTLEEPPGGTQRRVARLLLGALQGFTAAARAYCVTPGSKTEPAMITTSMWLWIAPALLLARPIRNNADDDNNQFATAGIVKGRFLQAERGCWVVLLVDYLKQRRQREEEEAGPLREDDHTTRKYNDAVAAVENDSVPKAVQTLLGSKVIQATEAIAEQVDGLAAVPPPEVELELIDAEVRLGLDLRATAIKPKEGHIRRASWAVGERRKAAPGPSGWRNSYIRRIAQESKDGILQSRLWSELWARGKIHREVARLWGAQIITPIMAAEAVGPGPSITEEPMDKLRPIALEEALVKFAEGAQLEACIDRILQVLEPSHLGTGTPDGPLLRVDVLRLWASGAVHRAKVAAQYPPGERKGKPAAQVRDEWMQEHWGKTDAQRKNGSSDHPSSVCPPAGTDWVQLLELIWSTDLKNAYGNVYRSAQLRGTRHLTPWLSAFLANKWVNRSNTQWQRVVVPGKTPPGGPTKPQEGEGKDPGS